MKTKRSQMKLGETIAVLVVFFILVMIGLVVYSNIRQDAIVKKIDERKSQQSIEIATMLTELPELKCSEFMCINCDGAVDRLKLEALATEVCVGEPCSPNPDSIISANRIEYAKMFRTTSVIVHVIPSPIAQDIEIQDYMLYDAKGNLKSSINPYFIPVNVYDAKTDECLMGVMEIATWS